jgi:hypothetical protein
MKSKTVLTKKEFVVVLVCIIFLILNVSAVTETGRGHAKQIVCLNNVKQLSNAWLLYTEDNDGELVDAHITTYGDAWIKYPPWHASIEQQHQAIRDGLLFPYIDNVLIYLCPTDQRLRELNEFAFTSFLIANGANGENWPGDHIPAKKYTELENPANKYVFLEYIDPRGSYSGSSWQMSFSPLRWIDPVAMWHKECTTLGFADGHSETHRWYNKSFIDWCYKGMYEPKSFAFYMTPPLDELEDITYMSNAFPCKSHR